MKQRFIRSAFLASVILLSIASSCRKDLPDPVATTPPPEQSTKILVKQIKWTESDHQAFSYNAQNQVLQFRNQWKYVEGDHTQLRTMTYDFQYGAQDLPVKVKYTGGFVIKYFYQDARLEKTREYYPNGSISNETMYAYSGGRIVQEVQVQRNLAGVATGNYKYTFSYDLKGNLNKIKSYAQAETGQYELFETTEFSDFDNKINPAGWALRSPYLPQMCWQFNNPGQEMVTPVNGTPRIFKYTYTYNASGVPVSERKTGAGGVVCGTYEY